MGICTILQHRFKFLEGKNKDLEERNKVLSSEVVELKKRLRKIEQSEAYMIGRSIVEIAKKPITATVKLPFRIFNIFTYHSRKKKVVELDYRQRKVSVIMTAYNSADTIESAIGSILNQTHSNLELIVVDDASSDDTFEVLLDYAKKEKAGA